MASETQFKLEDQLEGGAGQSEMSVPPPPTLILYSDTHDELERYDVGDDLEITIKCRIVGKHENGMFEIELSVIEIPKKPTVEEQGRAELASLGVVSGNTLRKLLNGEQ